MNILIETVHYAYARGYFDGRANGTRRNPYSDNDVEITEQKFYDRGFNDGASDFHIIDKDQK